MNSKRSSRRQFLQRAAAAGLAAGAVGSASAQSRAVAAKPEAKPMLAEASRFPFSGLEVTKRIDHITYYTPIQDSAGIITPAPLHFMQTHASEIPDLDPKEHRLTIHGMVERPLSFTLDELKRLPSVSRIHFVKWLKHIKVVDQPYITWNEAMNHSIPRPDLGGKSRWHHFQMAPKSVITRPSSGHTLSGPGFYEITGLAWSGYGTVRRVEISIDGGKTWKDARLQAPILRMAHTRFNFDWNWDGQETVIQSRCTDDQGETQLSVAELYKNWGYTDYKSQDKTRAIHFNAIQPWRIAKDGSVYDAMFD